MAAYYNEFDPFAAAWLRELIKAGHIADGEVDERSIKDVAGIDLARFTQCHFFAGIGGWSYALRRAAWPDHRPVWTGSCPCQPFSLAGKQEGFDDSRHLWPDFRRLIAECRPATVFGEQVASATKWLALVRSDLEAMEYAVGAMPIEAASAGAFHLRDRFWFVADDGRGRRAGSSEREGEQPRRAEAIGSGDLGNNPGVGRGEGRTEHEVRGWRAAASGSGCAIDLADTEHQGPPCPGREPQCEGNVLELGDGGTEEVSWVLGSDGKSRPVEPGVCLLAHGVPRRVAKLRGFGNAIDWRPATAFIQAADEAMNQLHPL